MPFIVSTFFFETLVIVCSSLMSTPAALASLPSDWAISFTPPTGTLMPSAAITAVIDAYRASVLFGAMPAFRVWMAMMSLSSCGNHLMPLRYALVVSLRPYRFCNLASAGSDAGSIGNLVSSSVIGSVSGA